MIPLKQYMAQKAQKSQPAEVDSETQYNEFLKAIESPQAQPQAMQGNDLSKMAESKLGRPLSTTGQIRSAGLSAMLQGAGVAAAGQMTKPQTQEFEKTTGEKLPTQMQKVERPAGLSGLQAATSLSEPQTPQETFEIKFLDEYKKSLPSRMGGRVSPDTAAKSVLEEYKKDVESLDLSKSIYLKRLQETRPTEAVRKVNELQDLITQSQDTWNKYYRKGVPIDQIKNQLTPEEKAISDKQEALANELYGAEGIEAQIDIEPERSIAAEGKMMITESINDMLRNDSLKEQIKNGEKPNDIIFDPAYEKSGDNIMKAVGGALMVIGDKTAGEIDRQIVNPIINDVVSVTKKSGATDLVTSALKDQTESTLAQLDLLGKVITGEDNVFTTGYEQGKENAKTTMVDLVSKYEALPERTKNQIGSLGQLIELVGYAKALKAAPAAAESVAKKSKEVTESAIAKTAPIVKSVKESASELTQKGISKVDDLLLKSRKMAQKIEVPNFSELKQLTTKSLAKIKNILPKKAVKNTEELMTKTTKEIAKQSKLMPKLFKKDFNALPRSQKKIAFELMPKLTSKEATRAVAEGRLVKKGFIQRMFGTENEVVASKQIQELSKAADSYIPGFANMDDVQRVAATRQIITDVAETIQPQLQTVRVAKNQVSQSINQRLDDAMGDIIRQITPQAKSTDLKFKKIVDDFMQNWRGNKNVTLDDLWDITKKYDDTVPEAVKTATEGPNLIAKEEWINNRRVFRDIMNEIGDQALDQKVSKSFKLMTDMYGIENAILNKGLTASQWLGKEGIGKRIAKKVGKFAGVAIPAYLGVKAID